MQTGSVVWVHDYKVYRGLLASTCPYSRNPASSCQGLWENLLCLILAHKSVTKSLHGVKNPSGKEAKTQHQFISVTPQNIFLESSTENLKILQGPKHNLTCDY